MRERKNSFLKYLAFTIEILIFYIIEGIPNFVPELLNEKPLFLLPIALSIAVFEREISSMFFGMVCGLLIDFGVSSHFGFYTFSLVIVCFFVGYIVGKIFYAKLILFLIINVIFVPLLISLNFFFKYIFMGYNCTLSYYINHTLPVICFTLILVPFFYELNKLISDCL